MDKAYAIVDKLNNNSIEFLTLNRADAEELVMDLCYERACGQFNGLLRLDWDLQESLRFAHDHQMQRYFIEEFILI